MMGWLGGLLVAVAALALYAGSPNQRWLAVVPRPAAIRWAGAAMMVAGLIVTGRWAGPATTVFIVMTVAMLVWSIVPLGIAWWRDAGDRS